MNYFLVAFGGAVGACLRYFISISFANIFNSTNFLFLATLLVNIVGCFFIGYFAKLMKLEILSIWQQQILIVGFTGSLTTFSTLIFDAFRIYNTYNIYMAIFYIAISILLGFLIFILAYEVL